MPSDFSIPYTDLELTTADNVKIKTFLLLQRPVLKMNETPLKWDEQPEEEVRQGKPSFVWSTSLKLMNMACFHMATSITVCGYAANGAHVSRKRWESWPPYPTGQDLLRKDAVQRSHVVLSWVRPSYLVLSAAAALHTHHS